MAIADCFEKHPGTDPAEVAILNRRSGDLQKAGKSQLEADRQVLSEMRAELDKDYQAFITSPQVKRKAPSAKQRAELRQNIIDQMKAEKKTALDKVIAEINKPFQDEISASLAASPLTGEIATDKPSKAGTRIPPSPLVQYDKKGLIVRPKPIVKILTDLQDALNALVTTVGQFRYTKTPNPGRNAAGTYFPSSKSIAIKKIGDLDTAAHELGHALDFAYGLFGDIDQNDFGAFHKELQPFSVHGSTPPKGHPDPMAYEFQEGIAEWIRAYLVNPTEAINAAPEFHSWYQKTIPQDAKKIIKTLSDDMRTLEGASGFDLMNASVEVIPEPTLSERMKTTKDELLEAMVPSTRNPKDFKLTWVDKIKAKFTDSLRAYESTVQFAASIGNIDLSKILPSNNPLIMARLFSGRNSKIQNFMEKGLVHFQSDTRMADKKTGKAMNVNWLLEPFSNEDRKTFEDEQRMMIAYGIAKRGIELPIKFIEKQIQAALKRGEIIPSAILYKHKRLYDKFFQVNEMLRAEIYAENDIYNEELAEDAKDRAKRIDDSFAKKKAVYEKTLLAQQKDFDIKRQELYAKKGKMDEKQRLSKLRILEQQATEARETFEKAIDGIELERFTAQQKLQGEVDSKMDKVFKETKLARIKEPSSYQAFTGAGGGIVSEPRAHQRTIDQFNALPKDTQYRINEALRRYRLFADSILQYMVDSGRLSQESINAIRANNEEYFMLQRVIQARPGETMESPSHPQAKAFGVVADVVYSIKGSGETIKDPYTSLLAFAHKAILESDRNFVLNTYVEFMNTAASAAGPDSGRITKLIAKGSESDKNKVTVFRGGEKHYYQLHPDIFKSMKGIVDQLYALPPIVRFFPSLLRASVINNPVFAARNTMRDYQVMMVISDNVRSIKDILPSKGQKAGNLSPRDAFEIFGGGQGGYHLLSEDFYKQTMEKVSVELAGREGNILVQAKDFAKLATESFGHLTEMSEKVTRMREYKNSFARAKKAGLDDYNAGLKAAFDARSLMDFAVIGEWMNVINQLIPFSNAKVQGLRVSKRALFKNPAYFALKAGLSIMLPAYLLRMMYDKEDEERLLQLPLYQRQMFWNIPVGDGWLMIPKPHDIAILATFADMTYDKAMDNKVKYDGFSAAMYSLMPFTRSDIAGPLRTFVELYANKDFFRKSNIVPAYEEKKDLALRNYVMASRVGKLIGETIGVDPRNVDHFIRGTFSYFGSQAMALSDIGRDDKNRSLAQMSGFYKNEPVYSYTDVQWAQTQAQRYSLETERYYMHLRWALKAYSTMESDTEKKEMSKFIREYSGYLKELWEEYGIHEEGSGAYKQEFRDKVRAQAQKEMSKSPVIKELIKMNEEAKKNKELVEDE